MSEDFICARQREETRGRISHGKQGDVSDKAPTEPRARQCFEPSSSCHHEGMKPMSHRCKCDTQTPQPLPFGVPRFMHQQPMSSVHSLPWAVPGAAGDQVLGPFPAAAGAGGHERPRVPQHTHPLTAPDTAQAPWHCHDIVCELLVKTLLHCLSYLETPCTEPAVSDITRGTKHA